MLIEDVLRSLVKKITDNPDSPNFKDTPSRVARMWAEFLSLPQPELTTFPLTTKGGMIILRNHESWGFCPHHLLPVKYTFRIGYLPEDRVLGLSKLARIADYTLTDLPLQEEIAPRIVNTLVGAINPKGAGCVVYGEHLCTRMRGVKSPCAEAISDIMWGLFLEDPKAREEFLML